MVWIDYAILGIILLSALISLVRGFAKEALSLVSWITAFFIASLFYNELSALLVNHIEGSFVRDGVAILILFLSTLLVGSLVNYLVGQLVAKTGLSGTDRVLGICFGAMRGVLVVSALLFVMDAFTSLSSEPWWQQSDLIPQFKVVIRWFFDYLEQSSSLLNQA